MPIDIHQHLWPEPFLAALRARRTAPRLEGWELLLPGRAAVRGRPRRARPRARAPRRPRRTATSWCSWRRPPRSASTGCRPRRPPSSPTPGSRARSRCRRRSAPGRWRARAEPDPAALRARSTAARSGSRSPPTCSPRPTGLDRLAPLLDVLDAARRPLLVHPGPAGDAGRARPARLVGARRAVRRPAARRLVGVGRRRPRALPAPAGLLRRARRARPAARRAPARPRRRPGAPSTRSRSSRRRPTAPRRVDAVIRALGIDVVCHGSDRPYAEPARPRSARPRCTPSAPATPGACSPTSPRRCPHDPRRVPRAARARPAERPHARARGARAPRRARSPRAASCGSRTSTRTRPSAPTPCLHRDAQLDVWAIFWLPENDTGWHDHDTSSGAVHVVDGELEEHALLVAAPERRTGYGAGAAFTFGPSHIHRAHLRVAARGLDPHVLAAAVAARPVHGRPRRCVAPRLGVLRRRAAPAGRRTRSRRRLTILIGSVE